MAEGRLERVYVYVQSAGWQLPLQSRSYSEAELPLWVGLRHLTNQARW